MKCSKCEKDIPNESGFCPYCGKKIIDKKEKEISLRTLLVLIIIVVLVAFIIGTIIYYKNVNNKTTVSEDNEMNYVVEEKTSNSENIRKTNTEVAKSNIFEKYLKDEEWVKENLYVYEDGIQSYSSKQTVGFVQLSDTIGIANVKSDNIIGTGKLSILTAKDNEIEISYLDEYAGDGTYDTTINYIVDTNKKVVLSYYSYRGVETFNIYQLNNDVIEKIGTLENLGESYSYNNKDITGTEFNEIKNKYIDEDLIEKEMESNGQGEFYTFEIIK